MILGQRDILLHISSLLDRHNIQYLLTGSFAVSYYGFPRATHDIDFVIETYEQEGERLLTMLKKLGPGYNYDEKFVEQAIRQRRQFDVLHVNTGIKIDFWISQDDQFARKKFQRSRIITVNREKIPTVSAEDLILTKLTWCKEVRSERHMRDCAGILKTQQDVLDQQYLSEWAKKLGVEKLLDEAKSSEY